ncbi:hypothetical protein JCM10908_005433 [Rhodotorula pacifica]|uniref:Zn(II)2Cys6 transcription factor domain-containing protein n=1 Tax=Rhodotorula pacifica TaxID=1495444 RepID=UPI0031742181
MDTPMQDGATAARVALASSEPPSTAASSSETSPAPTTEGHSSSSRQTARSTALATAARKSKKRKSGAPDGRSKAVVCDQCRTRKTSCDLKDPCSACGSKGILCSYERTDPVARVEKLQELEAKRLAREAALEELQQSAPPGHYDMSTRSGGRTRPARSTHSLYATDVYDVDEYMQDEEYAVSDGGPPGAAQAPAPAASSSRANGVRTHDTDSGFASSATSSATAAARSKARAAQYRPADDIAPSRRHYTNFGSAIIGADSRIPVGNDALRVWLAGRAEAVGGGGGGGRGRYAGPPPLPSIDLTGRVKDSILYHFPTALTEVVQDGPWVPGQPLPVASDAFDSPAIMAEDTVEAQPVSIAA